MSARRFQNSLTIFRYQGTNIGHASLNLCQSVSDHLPIIPLRNDVAKENYSKDFNVRGLPLNFIVFS